MMASQFDEIRRRARLDCHATIGRYVSCDFIDEVIRMTLAHAEDVVGYHGTQPLSDSEPVGTEQSATTKTLKSASPSLRAQVIEAGTNWCAHSHGHSGEKASLAAARAILLLAHGAWRFDENVGHYVPLSTLDSLLSELTDGQEPTGD